MRKASKKLTAAILMGLLAAAPFCANAETQTINTDDSTYNSGASQDFKGNDVTITGGETAGNRISYNVSQDVTFGNAGTITATGKWMNNAFLADGEKPLTISNIGSISLTDNATDSKEHKTFAFHGYNGTVNVTNVGNVTIKDVYTGLMAQDGGNGHDGAVNFDLTKKNGDLDITAHIGIIAADYSTKGQAASVDVKANNVTITRLDEVLTEDPHAAATQYGNNFAVVSVSQTYGEKPAPDTAGKTSVAITANTIKIDADSEKDDFGAILAANGKEPGAASVTLQAGNIDIAGDIVADTNASINIGAKEGTENTYTAAIKGDITSTNSTVSIDLGQNGSLTGAISDNSVNSAVPLGGTDNGNTNTGVKLDMGKGSVWNVTGDKISTVSTITGTGTIALNVNEDATVNGGVNVTDATGATLTVAAQQTADAIQSSEKALQNMAGATNGLEDGTVFKAVCSACHILKCFFGGLDGICGLLSGYGECCTCCVSNVYTAVYRCIFVYIKSNGAGAGDGAYGADFVPGNIPDGSLAHIQLDAGVGIAVVSPSERNSRINRIITDSAGQASVLSEINAYRGIC